MKAHSHNLLLTLALLACAKSLRAQTPPSTLFLLDTTNFVHCVATDACGNSSACGFTITILRPAELGSLSITIEGTFVTWPSPGILQQADSLLGPWMDVAGGGSRLALPFHLDRSNPMRFYRLRCN
jgi:hypothetical protein